MTIQIKNDNLEIFILTYNRKTFLKESVMSVLNQTAKVKITVVDNASDDGTQEFIEELSKDYPNLNYFRQKENVGGVNNLSTAINLANAPYAIFFHDDDIMHPMYIETVLKIIEENENISVVCSLLTTFHQSNEIKFKEIKKSTYYLFDNNKDFATYTYSAFMKGTAFVYPNVVYKTENLKNVKLGSKLYGKIDDKPFVINSVKQGRVAQIMTKDLLWYRMHIGQDSENSSNGPYKEEIINFIHFFKDLMDENEISKFLYKLHTYFWSECLYRWAGNNDKMIQEFLNELMENDECIFKHEPSKFVKKILLKLNKKVLTSNLFIPYKKRTVK